MLLPWLLFSLVPSNLALDNGLALTPPMGWLTWERFRCITDCNKYPNECISEDLIKRTSDLLVSGGYLSAGYDYIGIDDCWMEKARGEDGRLVPDRDRFPGGMKALGDYVHNKGLKFGIYQDIGNKTCGGYPGVYGTEQLDVDTIVGWGADYIKLDGCYYDSDDMETGYINFGAILNDTDRDILYSCSWPAYQNVTESNYAAIAEHCNLWRNWDDIDDSWASVAKIINWFGDHQDVFAKYAGPGRWNDPDMLIIGDYSLSIDQAQAQMAIWSVMAAPLLISTDLATIRPEFREILLNRDVIAVDQDRMGKQGLRVWKQTDKRVPRFGLEIWKRELCDGSFAMAFLSQREDGSPYAANFTFEEMALEKQCYDVKDFYHIEPDREAKCCKEFGVRVNPLGVKFYKFTPKDKETCGCEETEVTAKKSAKSVDLSVDNDITSR